MVMMIAVGLTAVVMSRNDDDDDVDDANNDVKIASLPLQFT